MSASLSPALVLIVGAALVPFLAGRVRAAYMLALPIVGVAWLAALPDGEFGTFTYLGLELVPLRVDAWSRMFGYVFFLAAFLSTIYALHVREWSQHVAGLVYAGAALGAVFAGDFLTLFVYWELTAVASVFLIWARGTDRAYRAGMRYLLIQLLSGMLLLGGAVAWYVQTGSLRIGHIGLAGLAGWLIFIAIGIKCAFPLLHNWLQDAYPEATEAGTVFLSAFTTKLAVYALARTFAGTEALVWIGATMTAFPIFYAVIENDLRRVLAYSLNNQLGFMVEGIGIPRNRADHILGDVLLLHSQHLHLTLLQLRVVLEINVQLEPLFEFGEPAALLLDEEQRDFGGHLDRNPAMSTRGRHPAHHPFEPYQHRLERRHLAEARAVGAVLGVVVQQARTLALPRHFDQTQIRHREGLGARPVLAQFVAQVVDHCALVRLNLHVDEINHDDSADVAQTQLAGNLAGRLEVGAKNRLFLILLAGETARVHIDRDERLGVIDTDVAALLEPHLALECLLDLALDAERVEDGDLTAIQLDAVFELR
jgi:hypothetical protein